MASDEPRLLIMMMMVDIIMLFFFCVLSLGTGSEELAQVGKGLLDLCP
jgi:hypothetical protein